MIAKFRVWNKMNRRMYSVIDSIGLSNGQPSTVRIWADDILMTFLIGEEVELMQSTGLKDKNGMEIFEGDIVRVFEYGRYGGTYNAPVSWISYSNEGEQWAFHGFTCIGVKEIEHHSEVESLFTRGFLTRQFGSCVQLSELTKDPRNSIKAIGNIYTNPELLEGR